MNFLEYIHYNDLNYLEEADANTHSTHIEDLCITDKKRGVGKALSGFTYIKNQFGVSKTTGKSPAVTIKIDGCLSGNTQVVTKKGPKAFKELTNKDYIKVINVVSGTESYEKNTLPRHAVGHKDWIQVEFSNGSILECTNDHPLFTKNKKFTQARYTLGVAMFNPLDEKSVLTVKSIKCIEAQEQFDLTTSQSNFVVQIGDQEIVVHNSPAIISGWVGNNFFVASKSLFNKEPKINFSDEDIDNNHNTSPGLAEKLHKALYYLKSVIPKGKIFQGDFLFDTTSRFSKTIDGVDSYVWQPNTIQYSVAKNTPLGKKIGTAKFGIIFHTEYSIQGEDYTTIKLKGFGVKESDLKLSKDVWFIDAYHHDMSTITQFSKEDNNLIEECKKTILSLLSRIDWNYDDTVKRNLLTFINSYIRSNTKQSDPILKAKEFSAWVEMRIQHELEKKKTERGKMMERAKWESTVKYAKNIKSLANLFIVHDALTIIKEKLIQKMDSVKAVKTFLVKNNGDLIVTGNEGFVLVKTSAAGSKFVDRYTFSLANFSPDFKKGWEH